MRFPGRVPAWLAGFLMLGLVSVATAAQSGVARADDPRMEPYFVWMIRCLGLYGLLTLLSGVALFIGACVLVCVTRRPAVLAAYLVFLPLPFLIGLAGALKGCVASFEVFARSGVEPKSSEILMGVTESLLTPMMALTVTFPSYLVIAFGLFIQVLLAKDRQGRHSASVGSVPERPRP